MKIAWVNLLEAATLSAGSQKASLPVENLALDPLSRKWHTAAGVTDSYFLADLGAAATVRVLALLKTNLTSAATLRVRASSSDATAESGDLLDTGIGSPLGPDSAGVDDDYSAVYKVLAADVSARYWRIDVADASLSNLQIGRAFLGPAWSPTRSMQFGHTITWIDESTVRRTDGGQDIVSEREKRRRLSFTLAYLSRSEMLDNAFESARARGLSGNYLVIPEESGPVSEYAVFGRSLAPISIAHESHNVYRTRYEIEERL